VRTDGGGATEGRCRFKGGETNVRRRPTGRPSRAEKETLAYRIADGLVQRGKEAGGSALMARTAGFWRMGSFRTPHCSSAQCS